MSIPINLNIANPNLSTLLGALKLDVQTSINCHAIGTITSITKNADNGMLTANATINYSQTYTDRNTDGTYSTKLAPYPQLVECPLIVMGGGSVALTFPVSVGDQCLVMFNDKDLSNWFAGARTGGAATARQHSLSDGLILVGFQTVDEYDADHALMTNGNAELGIQADGGLVRIANAMTTLNTLLGDLVSAIKNISTTNAVVGSPCLISPTSQAALQAVADEIATLLE